jgi:hypothetical protein
MRSFGGGRIGIHCRRLLVSWTYLPLRLGSDIFHDLGSDGWECGWAFACTRAAVQIKKAIAPILQGRSQNSKNHSPISIGVF